MLDEHQLNRSEFVREQLELAQKDCLAAYLPKGPS